MKKILIIIPILLSCLVAKSQNTIFDYLITSPQHTVLSDKILTTSLDDELSSNELITIFAPTDDAFQSISEMADLSGSDMVYLTNTLLQLIVQDSITSENFIFGDTLQSLYQSQQLIIQPAPGGNYFLFSPTDAALIITVDIICQNGVIHQINDVLLLPEEQIIFTPFWHISNNTNLQIFEELIVQAGLEDFFNETDSITVFAVDNMAFDYETIEFIQSLDSIGLSSLILNHVVYDKLLTSDLASSTSLNTYSDQSLSVFVDGDIIYIDTSQILFSEVDIQYTLGSPYHGAALYTLNSLLIPDSSFIGFMMGNDEQDDLNFKFQNPVSNQIFIKNSTPATVTILSISGQTIYQKMFYNDIFINTDFMMSGIYLINFNVDNKNFTSKFLK